MHIPAHPAHQWQQIKYSQEWNERKFLEIPAVTIYFLWLTEFSCLHFIRSFLHIFSIFSSIFCFWCFLFTFIHIPACYFALLVFCLLLLPLFFPSNCAEQHKYTHIHSHKLTHTHTDIRAVKQSSFLFGCNQAAHTIFLTSLWPAPDKLIPQRSHTHTHPCMCTLAKYCALPVGGDCYAASATCRNTKFASSPLHSFLSLFTQCSATTSAHTSVSHSWIFLQHKHTSAASAYKPLHTPDDACLSLCDCCLLLRYFQPPPTVVRKRKCIQNLIWQPWSWAKSAAGSRSTKWMGGKKDTTTTKNAC